MALCIIDEGYELACSSIGGIETIWIGTYSKDASYTLNTDNVITGATSASTVYEFQQDINHSGLEQTIQPNRDNGTVFIESVLSLKLIDLNADTRNIMLALAKAPIFAIAKSNTGNYFALGAYGPAGRLSEGSMSLGVAQGDHNGGVLSFTFSSQNGAYLINGALIGTSITVGS